MTGWYLRQLRSRSSALRMSVASLLLAVVTLLPATAWVHHSLEASAHAASINPHADDHDLPEDQPFHHHHDESHCQVCQMIHACNSQMVHLAPADFVLQQDCQFASTLDLREAPVVDLIGVHPSRAPPAWL